MGAHLAAFTGEKSIVVPGHFISTHRTQLFKVFIIGVIHHFKLRPWNRKRNGHTYPINFLGRFLSCNEKHFDDGWANATRENIK